jgi:hypothetical protein
MNVQYDLFGNPVITEVRRIEKEREKREFEQNLNELSQNKLKAVYYNFKLKHNGITSYKVFDGFSRNVSAKSKANLLSTYYSDLNQSVITENFDSSFGFVSKDFVKERRISDKQCKQIKSYCSKLAYYSSTRNFMSKKSGKYSMKVAFLTLTCPESSTNSQRLSAFEHFLDYLRRTANCVYVWKKEVGTKSKQLHFHVMINNFIPYYMVSWKWKRLLINEGVVWPVNNEGKHTESHYRIELPKSKRMVSSYIAKYMSKGESIPVYDKNLSDFENKSIGYLWGKSKVLDECKELTLMEGEIPNGDLYNIYQKFKIVGDEFVKHVCVDLMKVKDIAPVLFNLFYQQFLDFNSKISLIQRFQYV